MASHANNIHFLNSLAKLEHILQAQALNFPFSFYHNDIREYLAGFYLLWEREAAFSRSF